MNFEKLNRLIFTKGNPNNNYVSWDIGKQPLSPRYVYKDISENDYRRIIQAKTRLDEVVYSAVFEYVNNEVLCNDSDGMFPRSNRMTGNFYIAEESYYFCADEIRGSIMTHFTEMYCGGVITSPAEQDYLGLEVHFQIYCNGDIEVTGIDSSSI